MDLKNPMIDLSLICFPHYTCGGMLCDIFNDTFSRVGSNGGIYSLSHQVGKIGDSSDIFDDYDTEVLMTALKRAKQPWAGTHCHPIKLDNTQFSKIISVTTTTHRSKLYRWIRAYWLYYINSDPWKNLQNLALVDKQRETAKNYIKEFGPVIKSNIINIEFSEIVESSAYFKKITDGYNVEESMTRWREVNSFLYDKNLWNSEPVKRFYEAELEINLGIKYTYE
jgi:hypothetical protein